MNRKVFVTIGLLLTLVTLAATLAVYGGLPAQVPMHWNAHGQVDRYGPRWEALVVLPGSMLLVIGITMALPWLSPRRFEVNASGNAYLQIMVAVLVFMAYVQFLTLTAAMGRSWDMREMIVAALCGMFAAIGMPLARLRRNFCVGVRTPWTLASDRVWEATHRFAAKTFVAGGLAGLVLAFLLRASWPSIAALVAAGLAPVVHSLVFYKGLERRGEL